MIKELEVLKEIRRSAGNKVIASYWEAKALNYDKTITVNDYCNIIEVSLKRIPELEKELEDTHKAYSMAIEKHIKDENEYIKWIQEGGYDKNKLKALELIKENKWLVEDILDAFLEDKDKYDLLKKVLL